MFAFTNRALPKGSIVWWSGNYADIPIGWHLCDGTAGTIDLRNRFVVGAGSWYDPADTGGDTLHRHDFTADDHYHVIPVGTDIAAGADFRYYNQAAVVVGTSDDADGRPFFYALAFIQKL